MMSDFLITTLVLLEIALVLFLLKTFHLPGWISGGAASVPALAITNQNELF